MESSEEEEDFPSIESIIPQSKVDSLYQSQTEKVRSFSSQSTSNNAHSEENFYLFNCMFLWIVMKQKLVCFFFQGIRKLCCELLDLKDAVENLCGNMHSKFLAFLR